MNHRALAALGVLLLGTRTLAAQTVVTPEAKLSPEAQVVSDAIYRLRDSLLLVEAAGSRIARDRAQASDASLRSRAKLLAERCRFAAETSDSTTATIRKGGMPSPDPKGNLARMERATSGLKEKLVWCDTEFTRLSAPEQAEELRGYGIGRAKKVSDAIQSYTSEIVLYLSAALGARYKPSVRGAGSVATGATSSR
ncbi:MAG TPA: hypothetical protein VG817_02120 [Gemmatimonadales bacterium]|nr:hypothetical protein [Gemmatimonadales bacterium]